MMSNQGSMEGRHSTTRKRDYPTRGDDNYENPAKKPYSQNPSKEVRDKPYSHHSSSGFRERRKSVERSSRYGDVEGGHRGRDAPRRDSPVGRSSNPLGPSTTLLTERRKEDIDDEIAKYEKELLLLKRMKELKEERRRALN